jgi:hypothetical protein
MQTTNRAATMTEPLSVWARSGVDLRATTRVDIIDGSVEKAHIWINDVAEELGIEDSHRAYRVLRAFLHALRDHLSVDEAAQLAAQLPIFVRGVFYEGWDPSGTGTRVVRLTALARSTASSPRSPARRGWRARPRHRLPLLPPAGSCATTSQPARATACCTHSRRHLRELLSAEDS